MKIETKFEIGDHVKVHSVTPARKGTIYKIDFTNSADFTKLIYWVELENGTKKAAEEVKLTLC